MFRGPATGAGTPKGEVYKYLLVIIYYIFITSFLKLSLLYNKN